MAQCVKFIWVFLCTIISLSIVSFVSGEVSAKEILLNNKTSVELFNLYERDFDELTASEKTQAKRAAKHIVKNKLYKRFRVCADPGNMPLSNNKGEGFQNKIVEVIAKKIGADLSYFYRPYLERGLTRQTFTNRECDLLLGIPADYARVLTTNPIYRSTYVFTYRSDSGIKIKGLDDPVLRSKKVGVYQHSGIREALARHGIKEELEIHIISHNADLVKTNQPWQQVQRVVDGKLDIAGVWGPFAGFLVTQKKAPLILQPVNVMDDQVPLEFSVGLGVVKSNALLKYVIDVALSESKDEIEKILTDFGVPLVQCSKCVVQGNLPSHGSYFKRFLNDAKKRYTKPLAQNRVMLNKKLADEAQLVSRKRLEDWLKDGADIDHEFHNAVLASSKDRIKFLISKGADINKPNSNGYPALHSAAASRDSEMVDFLLSLNADHSVRDRSGWTALIHGAYRNHVPTIKTLIRYGADINVKTKKGSTALGLALIERNLYAANELIDAGADVTLGIGEDNLTPLMLISTQRKATARRGFINQGISVTEIAKKLIQKKVNVNAKTKKGITALMIAAGHNNSGMIGFLVRSGANIQAVSSEGQTALKIAQIARHKEAAKSLTFLSSINKNKNH